MVKVLGETGTPLPSSDITSVAGKFCFTSLNSTTTMSISDAVSWQRAYEALWGEKKGETLSLLRTFRDNVLTHTEIGRNYISLLYNHSAEILRLLHNPLLSIATGKVIDELLPAIHAVLEGRSATLSRFTVENILSLLNQYERGASPDLKTAIREIKSEVRGGELFRQVKIGIE